MEWPNGKGELSGSSNSKWQFQLSNYGTKYMIYGKYGLLWWTIALIVEYFTVALFLFIFILFACHLFPQYMRKVEYYILNFWLPRKLIFVFVCFRRIDLQINFSLSSKFLCFEPARLQSNIFQNSMTVGIYVLTAGGMEVFCILVV